ncbi:MAG: hypothetical protein ABW185_15975 [Sedimenticola sp.]
MRDRINKLIDATTDPYSVEIRYHHKCWLKYVVPFEKMSVEEALPLLHDVTFREAQTMFIDHAREVIFVEHEIRTVQSLLRDYQNIVGHYGFPTSGTKSSYIKELLVREFGVGIGFHTRPQKNQSEVVYDTGGCDSYVEAALSSLGVSNQLLVQNMAGRVRNEVKNTKTVTWPPQVVELEQKEELAPLLVQLVMSLKHPGKQVPDDTLACALSSILTHYITGRPTTTSINLSMTLHGLTRSKELIDTFHKAGICIRYASVLLLRDAWAVHDIQLCTDCPSEIAEDIPGVVIVDNDDFRNDTLTGGDTSHRTNVMYVQSVSQEYHDPQCSERVKDAKALSSTLKEITSDMQTHDRYVTHKRGEPPVSDRIPSEVRSTEPQRRRNVIHALVRADASGDRPMAIAQAVPGFSGLQALLSSPVEQSKAYYFMTYPDPPKKSVLNDVMLKVKAAIARKRMPFAVVVGDQPVYTLLLEIKSEHPQEYEHIIPFLGPFHTQCCMIYAIYKRHKGSEIAEVLVAAGVIAEGSVDQALRGKHYRRAMRCLLLLYEALMHLVLNMNVAVSQFEASTKARLAVLRDPTTNSQASLATAHEELESDPAIAALLDSLFHMPEGSDMGTYWLEFMAMVEVLVMNVHAVHTCNWDEYLVSLREMMPWMMIYDQTNYGRWLPDFWAMLTSLPADKSEFLSTSFAQSMTGKPYTSIPWDLWIEMTMNKGSKMKAGWLSILRNEKQLMADTINANNLARIRAALQRQLNRKQLSRKHNECSPKRMRVDEQAVQDLVSCIREFDCFPFDPASPALRTLQSAIPAPPKLVLDFSTAKQDGEMKLKTFMDERVYSKDKSLHDRIQRSNRHTFANTTADKATGGDLKVKQCEMESRALTSVVNIVDVSGLVPLSEVLKHRVTDECLTLFHVNGTLRKTQKSKLLQKLTQQPLDVPSYTALVDMGMIWRSATPTAEDREKGDGSAYTWGDYGNKVSSMVLTRHADATTIICVNDPYDHTESIKDDERELRIQGQGHVPNVFMKSGDKFPSAREFKTVLCSSGNKKRLQVLIKASLCHVAQSTKQALLYSVGEDCVRLQSGEVEESLCFDQCEADTIMLSIYTALRSSGCSEPVVIDAEDTDVYVQAVAISHDVPGILCMRKKKQLLFCRGMCADDDIAKCLIAFHVMTGCDANSCFYGHGKISLYEKMMKCPEARTLLSKCGDALPLTDDVLGDLKCYVIRYVYGDARSSSLDLARAAKWKRDKKKTLMRLPPDDDSLHQHIARANYLAYIQRHPDLRSHPSPIGHGWELVNGRCKPVRHTQPALPIALVIPSPQVNDESEDPSSVAETDDEFDSETDDSSDESRAD